VTATASAAAAMQLTGDHRRRRRVAVSSDGDIPSRRAARWGGGVASRTGTPPTHPVSSAREKATSGVFGRPPNPRAPVGTALIATDRPPVDPRLPTAGRGAPSRAQQAYRPRNHGGAVMGWPTCAAPHCQSQRFSPRFVRVAGMIWCQASAASKAHPAQPELSEASEATR
jgi:hypothetical protein